MLGCNLQTVNKWIDRGIITRHKVGTRLMIDRDSIVRFNCGRFGENES